MRSFQFWVSAECSSVLFPTKYLCLLGWDDSCPFNTINHILTQFWLSKQHININISPIHFLTWYGNLKALGWWWKRSPRLRILHQTETSSSWMLVLHAIYPRTMGRLLCSQILFWTLGNSLIWTKGEKLINTGKVKNETPEKHMQNTKQKIIKFCYRKSIQIM